MNSLKGSMPGVRAVQDGSDAGSHVPGFRLGDVPWFAGAWRRCLGALVGTVPCVMQLGGVRRGDRDDETAW